MARRNSIQEGLARASRAFTPFQAPRPPLGLYDPAIDSQQAAAGRGLLDLTQDAGTAGLRDTVDYGLGRDAIQRGQTRGREDLATQRTGVDQSFDRGTQDLATGSQRGRENYDQGVAALTRRYGILGGDQRQQQSRAGVMRGGAMLQAAAKRQSNQALDQQPLDTNFQRFQTDQQTAGTRLGEDHQTQLGVLDRAGTRLGEDTQLQLGDLALKMAPPDASNPFGGRSFQDRTTQLTRAGRENTAFGLDAGATRAYQAAGAGWVPPTAPSNEFVDPATGQSRRLQVQGRQTVAYDPSGRELFRRPRRAA